MKSMKLYDLRSGKAIQGWLLISSYFQVGGEEHTFSFTLENNTVDHHIKFFCLNDGAISSCGHFKIEHKENISPPSLEYEIRKVTNCPTGADLVTWCRFLRTGQLGGCENPVNCYAAIEDAILYHKKGAYGAEALDQILSIIVNEEAKRTNS